MIEYSEQELERFAPNDAILPQVLEAEARGDKALARELRKKMVIPAESLLMARDVMGAEWIRAEGLNTSEAERKWGENWMDRDDLRP